MKTLDNLDIFSETKHAAVLESARSELGRITALDDEQVEILVRSGFQSAQELSDADVEEVAAILEIDGDAGGVVIEGADQVVTSLIMEEAAKRESGGEKETGLAAE